ncbi:hypothetical protein N665_0519s0011 [Sinapis alba]|nr:hypothetical protein N665_0519s0011 [Sinapis alba]
MIACNPVTGEFIDLAKVKATRTKKSYVGYDPINKQFKVLFLTSYGRHNHVVTFGTRKQRSTIECECRHARQYDAEKHKWSKSICVLSHLYDEKIGHTCYIVGITSAGDIIFMLVGQVNPNFYLFFYIMERETCTRVDIKGFEEFRHHNFELTTYLNYVENMTPL